MGFAAAITPSYHGDTRFGLDYIDESNGVPWRALRAYRPIPDPSRPELGPFGTPRHWLQDPTFDGTREHQEDDGLGNVWVVPGATVITDSGGFGLSGLLSVPGEIAAGSLPGLVVLAAPVAVSLATAALAAPLSIAAAPVEAGLAEEVAALGGGFTAEGGLIAPIAPTLAVPVTVNVAEEVARLGGTMTPEGAVVGPIAPGAALPSLPTGLSELVEKGSAALKAAGISASAALKSLLGKAGRATAPTAQAPAITQPAAGQVSAGGLLALAALAALLLVKA